jgi:hypothetical protein
MRRREKCILVRGGDHVGNLDVGGRVIVKWILDE